MKRSNILLVEDDGDVSDAIAGCLEAHGYAVAVAYNGQEALDHLRDGSTLPNLILLDLMMPVMDGWQFRAEQTADPAFSGVPVVLISAHVDLADAADRLGAVGWLKKPPDLRALLRAVERTVA